MTDCILIKFIKLNLINIKIAYYSFLNKLMIYFGQSTNNFIWSNSLKEYTSLTYTC